MPLIKQTDKTATHSRTQSVETSYLVSNLWNLVLDYGHRSVCLLLGSVSSRLRIGLQTIKPKSSQRVCMMATENGHTEDPD